MCTPPGSNAGPDTLVTTRYTTATSAYQATASILQAHEINTHIILSYILAQLTREQAASTSQQPVPLPSLWIAVWTTCSHMPQNRTLDLIIALTAGPVGPRPLFIASPHTSSTLTSIFLRPRIDRLITELLDGAPEVPVDRIFSVFGSRRLTQYFVATWSRQVQVSPTDSPYMSATYRICTSDTLIGAVPQRTDGVSRLATTQDLDRVSELLQSRSTEIGPYILNGQTARLEAQSLISTNQLYVCESRTSVSGVITSIAAVERTSANVASVNKFYTSSQHRNQGFGSKLLSSVCQFLLHRQGRSAVVIYLSDGSSAADTVTQRVGFRNVNVGVHGADRDWLEQGFQDMNLGHW
ncbi:hypothetical protein FRB97_009839 [Tulasnella sp. 331]|nr:hypothetical protein FRB97_009839 [Tulasnella sp. 331]